MGFPIVVNSYAYIHTTVHTLKKLKIAAAMAIIMCTMLTSGQSRIKEKAELFILSLHFF